MRAKSLTLPVLLLAVGACSDSVVQSLRVVRIASENTECGAPMDARSMVIRALGEFPASESSAQSIELGEDGTFTIGRFGAETRMLEVSVRGFGGAVKSIGRSLEFSLQDLPNEAQIPIFMAPPNGICPTGAAGVPRASALLAMTGSDVLVVGGMGADGRPEASAERYIASTGTFESIESAPLYGEGNPAGLQGASATELDSGDVVIVGGAATAYQVYSAAKREFGTPAFYREARGHHAAVAISQHRVFLVAGCSQVLSNGSCAEGSELLTSGILDVNTGVLQAGPKVQLSRIGGKVFVERSNARGEAQTLLLVGGLDLQGAPVAEAERLFLDGRPSQRIADVQGQSVQSQSGSIWAFSDSAQQVLKVDASTGTSIEFPEMAVLSSPVSLQDGSVLLLTSHGATQVSTLNGQRLDWILPELQSRQGTSAIRLLDGSVLVVGGLRDELVTAEAFVIRPKVLGPFSPSVAINILDSNIDIPLSASSPQQASVTAGGDGLVLSVGPGGEPEWMIATGPVFEEMQMTGIASTTSTLLMFFGWQSPSETYQLTLKDGFAPTLTRFSGDSPAILEECDTKALAGETLGAGSGNWQVQVQSQRVEVQVAGATVLSCSLDSTPRGSVGIGVQGQAAEMVLRNLSVNRL